MKKRRNKSAKVDFTIKQLPQTRKEQFFNILKNQYLTILKAGFVLLLVFLPALLADLGRNIFDEGYYKLLQEGTIVEGEYHTYLLIDLMVQTGIEFLFIPLFTVAFAGLNNVFKIIVQGDNVLFRYDFTEGVRNNFRSSLVLSLVFGVFFLTTRFVCTFFITNYFIVIPVYAFFIIFIIPLTLISLIFTTYYEGSFTRVINNSMKLFAPNSYKYVIFSVLIFGVIYGCNLGFDGAVIPYIKTAVFIALLIFALPLLLLALHSTTIAVFDKYINISFYPQIYKKGIYNPLKEKEGSKRKEKNKQNE